MRTTNHLILISMLMALLLGGCAAQNTTSGDPDPAISNQNADAATQTGDPMECMAVCDDGCQTRYANSPLGYDFCFERCLDKCSEL